MKSQNDLIISIVAGVFAIGFALGFFFTKREPGSPAAAPKVNTAPVQLPAATVSYKSGLGGGGAAGGFGGGAGFGGSGLGGGPRFSAASAGGGGKPGPCAD